MKMEKSTQAYLSRWGKSVTREARGGILGGIRNGVRKNSRIESSPVHMKLYFPSNNDETDLLETLNCTAADFISRPEPKTEDVSHLIRWVFDMPGTM
jgi:hypothetical protein